MRALIDTHVLLWWLADDPALRPLHRELILDTRNEIYVSAVSLAEIAIKASLGKLEVPSDVSGEIERGGFSPLPFEAGHAELLRELPWHHRDPFDRMLIAQAECEGLSFATVDRNIRRYEITCL